MIDRESAAIFVDLQLGGRCGREKAGRHHYGLQELRELLDYIYGGKPEEHEKIATRGDKYKTFARPSADDLMEDARREEARINQNELLEIAELAKGLP